MSSFHVVYEDESSDGALLSRSLHMSGQIILRVKRWRATEYSVRRKFGKGKLAGPVGTHYRTRLQLGKKPNYQRERDYTVPCNIIRWRKGFHGGRTSLKGHAKRKTRWSWVTKKNNLVSRERFVFPSLFYLSHVSYRVTYKIKIYSVPDLNVITYPLLDYIFYAQFF